MSTPQEQRRDDGTMRHLSVGAIIEREGRYLLIDRTNKPFGFAGLAGHIDEGEEPLEALHREVREEGGVAITDCDLISEGEYHGSGCVYDVRYHYWYLYRCRVEGEPQRDPSEARSMGWYTPEEITNLNLEPAWRRWFAVAGVIE